MYELWKDNLLDFGALLLTTYKDLELNEQEYVFLVLFARLLQVNANGWTFSDISNHMTIDEGECSYLFISLVERKYILVSSKVDDLGKRFEEYSLTPLFSKIESCLKQRKNVSQSTNREEIFTLLETEFGILSPKDIETVQMWLLEDQMEPELIKLAVQEMNSYQIKSLRYVDKILLEWKKKNITTLEEAKRQLIAFRQRKQGQTMPASEEAAVNPDYYYDWMG